jgi:hypothetical protein
MAVVAEMYLVWSFVWVHCWRYWAVGVICIGMVAYDGFAIALYHCIIRYLMNVDVRSRLIHYSIN